MPKKWSYFRGIFVLKQATAAEAIINTLWEYRASRLTDLCLFLESYPMMGTPPSGAVLFIC